MFHLVVVAGHSPYVVINRRWPSFPDCYGSCLKQSTAARYICAVVASLPQLHEDVSLQALLPVITLLCLRSDIVIFGHINCFCYLVSLFTHDASSLWLTNSTVSSVLDYNSDALFSLPLLSSLRLSPSDLLWSHVRLYTTDAATLHCIWTKLPDVAIIASPKIKNLILPASTWTSHYPTLWPQSVYFIQSLNITFSHFCNSFYLCLHSLWHSVQLALAC